MPRNARRSALLSIQVAITPDTHSLPYSSSANSARPCFEFRYSFLWRSACNPGDALCGACKPLQDSPLNSPLHSGVSGNHRGNEVEDLVARAAHDVPEALADEGGHGTLPVGAERVRDYALARSATALIGVAPGANVPSVCGQPAAQLTHVVCAGGAVFCAEAGGAACGEGNSDCGRRGRTYVALCFALGSEPPPAIVKCRVGGCTVGLGGGGLTLRMLLQLTADVAFALSRRLGGR